MAGFDKKRCLSNVYFLTKQKGLRLGDVETGAGVSPGYFSRLNKGDSSTNPSIEVLVSVADTLGITLDALCGFDFSSMTESERFVASFLDKLIEKSRTGEAIWIRETVAEMSNIDIDEQCESTHPMFTAIQETSDDGYHSYWRIAYMSPFFRGEEYRLVGDGFKLPMSNDNTLYLYPVMSTEEQEPPTPREYDLCMVKSFHVDPICRSSLYGSNTFKEILPKLYEAAGESNRHIGLNEDTRRAINYFMTGMDPIFSNDLDLPF